MRRGRFGLSLTFFVVVTLILLSVSVQAVSITADSVPRDADGGETISVTFTITKLYQDPSYEQWTLRSETELIAVTWTYELVDQAGNVIETNSVNGQSSAQAIAIDEAISEVQVRLSGTVPDRDSTDSSIILARFTHTREGGVTSRIEEYRVSYPEKTSTDSQDTISEREVTAQPSGDGASPATSDNEDVNRGFFSNDADPNSPLDSLSGPHITTIGFLLSILGILLELRGGG